MKWCVAVKAITALIGGVLGFLFGQLNGLFWAIIAMMVLDYISGVLIAVTQKKISSEVGAKGIAKKVFILLLTAVGHIIDTQVIKQGAVVMSAVQLFFIANEGISIVENAAILGLPVPKKLREVLEQIRKSSEEGDDSNSNGNNDKEQQKGEN